MPIIKINLIERERDLKRWTERERKTKINIPNIGLELGLCVIWTLLTDRDGELDLMQLKSNQLSLYRLFTSYVTEISTDANRLVPLTNQSPQKTLPGRVK